MTKFKWHLVAAVTALMLPGMAHAVEAGEVKRSDARTVTLHWQDNDPVSVYTSTDPEAGIAEATLVASNVRSGTLSVPVAATERRYFLLRDGGDGSVVTVAERELPLERGSNFRDLGGYRGADGRMVRWGRIFRSGAMPLLTSGDYALLGGLKIDSIVELRSLDERMIAPTELDDRTGAAFLSNDYSLKTMMANMMADREYLYRDVGKALAPQYRMIFRRLLANDGAVLYNCSAGQDRTGVATALVLSALGVDRQTILRDYHLSTALRRPQNEMPPLNPADWPGNPIVPYYVAAMNAPGGPKAEPLFTPSGASHLVRFFEVIERDYGSVEAYLDRELGVSAADVKRLQAIYLQ